METHRAGDRVKHCVKDAGNRWAGRRGGLSAQKTGCIEILNGGGLSISRTLDVGAFCVQRTSESLQGQWTGLLCRQNSPVVMSGKLGSSIPAMSWLKSCPPFQRSCRRDFLARSLQQPPNIELILKLRRSNLLFMSASSMPRLIFPSY